MMTDDELLEQGLARLQWMQQDMLYKPPEALGSEGLRLQSALPWIIAVVQDTRPEAHALAVELAKVALL